MSESKAPSTLNLVREGEADRDYDDELRLAYELLKADLDALADRVAVLEAP